MIGTRPTQIEMVLSVLEPHDWKTLDEISLLVFHRFDRVTLLTAISARLRDIRATGREVQRRLRSRGLWEYRLAPPPPQNGRLFQ